MSALRVALCTAAVGCGHTTAAKAIWQALRTAHPDARIDLIEALDLAPRWFTAAYRDGYLRAIAHAPAIAGRMYDATDHFVSRRGLGHVIENLAMRRLVDHPLIRDAHVVVTTHFLCARVLSWARADGRLTAPLCVCVTDQHPHGVWLVPHADLTLVASDAARATAIRAGLLPDRVQATGIPVNPRFQHAPCRQATVQTHALPADRPIVLIAGGGLGLGGLDAAVHGALGTAQEIHVVAICGKNTRLHASLLPLRRAPMPGAPSCDVLGYTTDMPDLMAIASVLVGKPGGLTTAEACARGLPMVLLKPIPGQEERNAERLVSLGAAILQPDPLTAGRLAGDLAMNIDRLAPMRDAAGRAGRSDAASVVARHVVALAGHRVRSPVDPLTLQPEHGGTHDPRLGALGLTTLEQDPCPAC